MRVHRRWILGFVVLAALTAAPVIVATTANAVADGTDVPDGRYGFAAALSMPLITRPDGSTYSSACSGALISPRWVITAGHCLHDGARNRIEGAPRYEVQVTVGQATRSGTTGSKRQVVEVRQSPTADVALVRLDRAVLTTRPIPLSFRRPQPGDVLRLTGWGTTDSEGGLDDRPDRLQTGQVTVSRVTDSEVFVRGLRPAPTTSACAYDSGAPYFRETGGVAQLVATEVTGPDCPHDQEEETARIDAIARWILRQMVS
jgi:secreted trypsin-like serine protease